MGRRTCDIGALIDTYEDGYSLDQPFYLDQGIFDADFERVIEPMWLFVDHVSRIPNAGDYFLFEIAGESIIVVRGRDQEIRAFYNVCRHRGSRICREKQGNAKLLMCPYHAWSFDLDGTLKAARTMPEGFDPGEWGLHPCHARVREGLIFLNLSRNEPPDFEDFIKPLLPCLELHDLGNAKVAHSGSYPTDANWKLVLENFFECYHCQPSHPEYCQVHPKDYVLARGAGKGSGPDGSEEAYQPQLDAFNARAAALGHTVAGFSDGAGSLHFRGSDRTGIQEGWLSETEDGTPAAPLMGKFTDWDGGYTGISFNPLSTLLMTNDFATAFRFTPIDATHTDVELIWMVRADAEEGKDYDKEKMIWLWDVTTIADKRIIEDNHAGVTSRRYQPGPYSDHEHGTQGLIHWYLNRLRG
ncbi:MAG: aromatic ring-hydroxylating dioxygenase subunit alpha [Rhodospirillales bacterium]|nr:aromatic ring-hydroxylating dioxygenase subunit alpha [Rhodospirillales bacterium]